MNVEDIITKYIEPSAITKEEARDKIQRKMQVFACIGATLSTAQIYEIESIGNFSVKPVKSLYPFRLDMVIEFLDPDFMR